MSPGCVVAEPPPYPEGSSIDFADVWQYAQTPYDDGASACKATYKYVEKEDLDGGPGYRCVQKFGLYSLPVDLNVSNLRNPSAPPPWWWKLLRAIARLIAG
jgi:hypothetical protein